MLIAAPLLPTTRARPGRPAATNAQRVGIASMRVVSVIHGGHRVETQLRPNGNAELGCDMERSKRSKMMTTSSTKDFAELPELQGGMGKRQTLGGDRCIPGWPSSLSLNEVEYVDCGTKLRSNKTVSRGGQAESGPLQVSVSTRSASSA